MHPSRAMFIIRKGLHALSAILALLPAGVAIGQPNDQCAKNADGTISICFQPPITDNLHCGKIIVPQIKVVRQDEARKYRIRFDVRFRPNSHDKDISATNGERQPGDPSEFSLTDEDTTHQVFSSLQIPFKGNGQYSTNVTIFVQKAPDKPEFDQLSASSIWYSLNDKPNVRAVIIGVSRYLHGNDNPGEDYLQNLHYADDDARAFASFLKRAFPDGTPIVMTSDSGHSLTVRADGKRPSYDELSANRVIPSRLAIDEAFDAVDRETSNNLLCSADDWFIFYFSGHGIVAGEPDDIRHYLSTYDSAADDLLGTSIWIGDLLGHFKKVSPHVNKLFIIDSCFSGSDKQQPTQSQGFWSRNESPKRPDKAAPRIAYVERRHFKSSSTFSLTTVGAKDTTDQLEEYKRFEDNRDGKFEYLAASGTDHAAEEGPIIFDGGNLKIPADDDQTSPRQGAGYFTYTLLAHLKEQMTTASAVNVTKPAPDSPPAASDRCEISVILSFTDTMSNFLHWKQRQKELDLQIPYRGNSNAVFSPLPCSLSN